MITVRSILISLLLVCIVGLFLGHWEPVYAVETCTATVSPATVQTSTDTNFAFTITNTGDGTINYVKIVAPSTNFTLENYGVAGWGVNANSQFAELTGGSILSGAVFNFNYHGMSGSSEAGSANWTVSTNTGSGVVNCTGSLGTAISGVADRTAPDLTDLTVSDIGNTAVTVNWTTDEAATSYVDYGLNEDYGTIVGTAALTSAHAVTLTGLTSNTTYSFRVYSTDSSGNMGQIAQNTVTTAVAGQSAPAVSVTTTTITAASTTVAPVVIVLKDSVAPNVVLTSDLSGQYEQAPLITGRASDTGAVNAGIAQIEYSTDDGKNWLAVDSIETPNSRSTVFSFLPTLYDDGNYQIRVRARDNTGNIGTSTASTLVIDRLPPVLGGAIVNVGPVVLAPNQAGVVVTQAGVKQKITLSMAGGVIAVKLLYGGQTTELTQNSETGLWGGEIAFAQAGSYLVEVAAKDGAENNLKQSLFSVEVLSRGSVSVGMVKAAGAELSVYVQEPMTGLWQVWEGKSFGQENPAKADQNGEFGYILPAGKYYLKVRGAGGVKGVSQIFVIDQATPLPTKIELRGGRLWSEEFSVMNQAPAPKSGEMKLKIGEKVPVLDLPGTVDQAETAQLAGKASIISFVGLWLPSGVEQIGALDMVSEPVKKQVMLVAVQDNLERVGVMAARGGYGVNIAIDRDGVAARDYGVWYLPTHFVLDRRGVVWRVVTGVLSAREIAELLEAVE